MSVLEGVRTRNDQGHPMCANLRDGHWMLGTFLPVPNASACLSARSNSNAFSCFVLLNLIVVDTFLKYLWVFLGVWVRDIWEVLFWCYFECIRKCLQITSPRIWKGGSPRCRSVTGWKSISNASSTFPTTWHRATLPRWSGPCTNSAAPPCTVRCRRELFVLTVHRSHHISLSIKRQPFNIFRKTNTNSHKLTRSIN